MPTISRGRHMGPYPPPPLPSGLLLQDTTALSCPSETVSLSRGTMSTPSASVSSTAKGTVTITSPGYTTHHILMAV